MNLEKEIVQGMTLPYMVKSQIDFKMVNVITYYQLLEMYDKTLLKQIQSVNAQLLGEQVFLFEAMMTPESLHWK